MKTPRRCQLLILAATMIFASISATAQTRPASDASRPTNAMLQRLKDAIGQFDLAQSQRDDIDKIVKQASDDIRNAAPDLANASADDKAAKYREIFTDLRQQIAGVLNDDQRQQLQQKMQAMREGPAGTPHASATSMPAATTAPATPPEPAAAGGGRGGLLPRFRDALAQLDLTDDQKKKVDTLLEDVTAQAKQLRQSVQSGSISRADVQEKRIGMLQDLREKLSGILTPDQQQKLRSILQSGPGVGGGGAVGGGGLATPRSKRRSGDATPPTPTTTPTQTGNVKADDPSKAAVAQAVAPDVGQAAPDFQLKLLNGNSASLADEKHHIFVLVFGSATAPVFRDHAAALNALHEKYGSRGVQFLVVYTKEQHPVGGWELQRNKDENINIPLAKTASERATVAQQLHDSLHLSLPIAADSMDDAVATAYGVNQTVPAYVIDRAGTIAFHQSWLEPDALSHAIDDALTASKTD
jgi:Spy/CpxP family protein refolding chaperone/peroxiredoxin